MSDVAKPLTPDTVAAEWRGGHLVPVVPGIDGYVMVSWDGVCYRVPYIGERPSDEDALRFVKERHA